MNNQKLAIMQPYFFPYIGYFSLIQNTDYFIFFDTPQYIRKGWINRNRILNSKGEAVFFTVPVKKALRETAINQTLISPNANWQEKIFGQLTVYKKRAPYYNEVVDLVRVISEGEYANIAELAVASVVESCKYLRIDIKYEIFSNMNLTELPVKEADEWALYITKEMGYGTYVNPPGGKSFFHSEKYSALGIELKFLCQEIVTYQQFGQEFVPGLSILDLMMFCKPQEIVQMMDAHILKE